MTAPSEALVTLFYHLSVTTYFSFAATAVYLYDWLLTFEDEVSFFWEVHNAWLINLLFLANRYLPIVGLVCFMIPLDPSRLSTPTSSVGGIVSQMLGTIAATAIFCLRVCTVYQNSFLARTIVIASFWFSLVAFVVLGCICVIWLGTTIEFRGGRCISEFPVEQFSYTVGGAYLAPLLCETVVMIAMAKHAINMRQNRKVLTMSSISPALDRLHHDGFAYFVIVFSLRLICCLVMFFCPPALKPFFSHFANALTSVATSRFFLSLRRSIANSRTYSLDSKTSTSIEGTHGTVVFMSPLQGSARADPPARPDPFSDTLTPSKVPFAEI